MSMMFHPFRVQPLEARRLLSAGTLLETVPAGYDPDGAPAQGTVDYVSPPDPHADDHADGVGVLPVPETLPEFAGPEPVAAAAAFPLSDTFSLSSLPGADKTIYLDFDGHTTSGQNWNWSFNGGNDINTPAYDTNGSAGFSNGELDRIQQIYLRVAEDFAPFNLNVTTQEPPVDDLQWSFFGDTRWGVRVVIGGDGDWYGNAGGVAYVGSFGNYEDVPTFVFSDRFGSAKSIAEAASHEAGHTLGLYHDGVSGGPGYYGGHGDGPTSWGPLMGVGYYTELTQWSSGEYSGADNSQDDLAEMANNSNDIGYRTDDHVDAVGPDATLLPLASDGTASIDGLITTRTDQDAFRFTHGGGTLGLTLEPASLGANLDASLELFRDNNDGTYTSVAFDNPSNQLDANLLGTFDAGTYVARVDGVGKGDPLGNGYTDYGSIGQYTLNLAAAPGDAVAPSITRVGLASSTWTNAFADTLANGFAIFENDASADRVLPWSGLDTFYVTFDEGVNVNANDLSVTMAGQELTVEAGSFAYDASTAVASWRLAGPVTNGSMIIDVSGVTDLAGNALGATSPFAADVLVGDITGDGAVNLADFGVLRQSFNAPLDGNAYSLFADLDGTGSVALSDFGLLRGNFNAVLA